MEAALAEFKAEELGQDIEEDNDFTVEVGMFGTYPLAAFHS